MTEDFLADLTALYDAYVAGFRVDGALPDMMHLKRIHTDHVVANARAIAAGEGFDELTTRVCTAAALLHDTGRYEQLKRYNTFRDSDSVDHAVFSHDIVRDLGWLEPLAGEGNVRQAIFDAVLFHNRRDVPEGLDPLTRAAAHTVRDADKLDIFRVLEDRVEHTNWRDDCKAFWNLPIHAAPNSVVLAAIREGRPVDYQNIKTLADFVLIQVGWMIAGLQYATTRRLAAARGHLAFRRDFLHELVAEDVAAVDEICGQAEQALEK